jgi:hypothetical protein
MKASVEGMRDPVITWTLQPVTWSTEPTVQTGTTATLVFPADGALTGDVGYAQLWVQAKDADGLLASVQFPIRARVDNCCISDMFSLYFLYCSRQVGVNMEKCPLPIVDP